jgi:hypothetical protein
MPHHLHRDLKIPTIRQEIQSFAERHERRPHNVIVQIRYLGVWMIHVVEESKYGVAKQPCVDDVTTNYCWSDVST